MRIKINNYINFNSFKKHIIKRIDSLYGKNVSNQFIASLDNVENFYVEELNNTLMQSREKEIAIDKQWFKFDKIGNIVSLNENVGQLFRSTLGHELIHSASRNNGYVGICKNNDPANIGLNEGITQMFTDEIFGYTTSKYSDPYSDFKKIAKIFKITFGINPVYKSYFDHTNDLEKQCNNLALSKNFYNLLNKKMTTAYAILSRGSLYNRQINNIYKDVVINIIVPNMKSLNEKDRKKYINSILSVMSDDFEKLNIMKSLISKFAYLDIESTIKEMDKMKKENEYTGNCIQYSKMIKNNPNAFLNSVYVCQSGEVRTLTQPQTIITDKEVLKETYKLLGNNSYTFPDSYLNKIINIITSGNDLKISGSNTLERRKIFESLRDKLFDKGIFVLNTYSEIDDFGIVRDVSYIKASNKVDFEDLKTIFIKYGIKNSDEKNDDRKIVYDRKTGEIIEKPALIMAAKFANLWLTSAKDNKKKENESAMETAFSKENEKIYTAIISFASKGLKTDGNFNPNAYFNSSNKEISSVTKKLFSNPLDYETSYDFFKLITENQIKQTEREKSYAEMIDPKYIKKYVDKATEDILRR